MAGILLQIFFGTHGEFLERETLRYKIQNGLNYRTFSYEVSPNEAFNELQDDIQELNDTRYADEREKIFAELDLSKEKREIIADILIEELAFSLEMSPIFSRLKKTIQRISAASQAVIELSDKYAQDVSNYMIDWLEEELPGYQKEYTPLEALETACKYKKLNGEITAYKLALYREALKDEIPLTNWIAGPSGFYMSYAAKESGAFAGDPLSDVPALLGGGFALMLLDP